MLCRITEHKIVLISTIFLIPYIRISAESVPTWRCSGYQPRNHFTGAYLQLFNIHPDLIATYQISTIVPL
jgi:hypothetical protein